MDSIPFQSLHQSLLPALGLGVPGLQEKLKTLASLARAEWIRLAKSNLNTTASDYVRAIQPVEIMGQVAVVALVGMLPNMIERGKDPFDLRDTLLKPSTRSVKRSKEGYLYLAVPFRHKAASLSAEAVTERFRGKAPQQVLQDLSQELRQRSRKLRASLTAAGGSRQWGGRLDIEDAPKLRERHAGDIFSGMVRQEKTYAKATQSQYASWRMISNNPASMRSDNSGQNWSHPGIKARNLARQVATYMQSQVHHVMSMREK